MERIGLFGGTFDPPHLGHLILASVICEALALERVLFVPAADPPHKKARQVTAADHRLAMLHAALDGDSRFAVSLIDVLRPGPHYSVDTVACARAEHPGGTLFFLMGSDSLADLHLWYRPDLLVEDCALAVLRRPGAPVDLAALESVTPDIHSRVIVVDGPGIAISASMIRERVGAEQSIRYLVPDAVREYIDIHRLYR
jgi:nicotinate-nucleotide adenylyltransferase